VLVVEQFPVRPAGTAVSSVPRSPVRSALIISASPAAGAQAKVRPSMVMVPATTSSSFSRMLCVPISRWRIFWRTVSSINNHCS